MIIDIDYFSTTIMIIIIINNNNIDNKNNYQSFKYLPNKLICLLLHKIVKKSSVEITTTTNRTESTATPALLQSGSLSIRFCASVNTKRVRP